MTDTTTAEQPGTTRVHPVQSRGHATLGRIRSAALTVIAERGRDRFTTQDIAEEAGVSIGTVYRYFEDRHAVLEDLYPDRTEGLAGLADRTAYCTGVADAIAAVRGTWPRSDRALDELHARLVGNTASLAEGTAK